MNLSIHTARVIQPLPVILPNVQTASDIADVVRLPYGPPVTDP